MFIVGTKTAINRAIDTVDTHKRNTLLATRIKVLFDQAEISEFKIKKFRNADLPDLPKSNIPQKSSNVDGQIKFNFA